jgi:hypothetical protein
VKSLYTAIKLGVPYGLARKLPVPVAAGGVFAIKGVD